MSETSVVWFRRDLRVRDQPTFLAAADAAPRALALFVLDPALLDPAGPARRTFLYRSLRDLDAALGGSLLVVRGDPAEEVPRIAAAVDAGTVHVAADFGPYGRERDVAVEEALEKAGIELVRTGSPYAVDPDTGERYDDVVVIWVPSEDDKRALIADRASPFFTTAHFDGYLSVLVRLSRIGELLMEELTEVIQDAWLSRASRRRAQTWLAEHGLASPVPLIRDDAATVLVGRARHLGAEGAKLHGETYVDSERLFTGEVGSIRIEPTPEEPGLRAQVERLLLPGRWSHGRAAQTGGTNIVVEREGVVTTRVLKRSTFYRHDTDLLLVRP